LLDKNKNNGVEGITNVRLVKSPISVGDNNELFHPKGLRITGNNTILVSE
jgi:hypothetical protein